MCNGNNEFLSKEYLINQIESLINRIYNNYHRPFYSEMDFQYNLLLMLEQNKPKGWSIYTEVPYDEKGKEKHRRIDICAKDPQNNLYLIELKYKTAKEKYFNPFWDKTMELKQFSCYTDNRKAFFVDVEKLKNLFEDKENNVKLAYAVFLTNDKNYTENEHKKSHFMGKDKDNSIQCSLKEQKNDQEPVAIGEWHEIKYKPFIKASIANTVYFNIVEINDKIASR